MAGLNYLLGFGERLARPISIRKGGGAPRFPWTFDDARKKLAPQWRTLSESIAALPALACPEGQSVVSITLHPSFLARSHYPTDLLRELNLRPVGSRARTIGVETKTARAKKRQVPLFQAPQLFVAGDRERIERFANTVSNWRPTRSQTQDDYRKIYDVAPLDLSRLKAIAGDDDEPPLEIVLHASETDDFIIEGFRDFASDLDLKVDLDRRMYAGGLCFLPMRSPRDTLEDLAQYSFIRVIRRMASLSLNESILRTSGMPGSFSVKLPNLPPMSQDIRAAVFDGGIADANNPVAAWVRPLDAPGVGPADLNYQAHGLAVTSALLFGPLESGVEAAVPFSRVDHWRVLDTNTKGNDFELMDVLDRILNILRQREYDFVCLSIGPANPIEDDDVHFWTSRLDDYLASKKTVLVCACGNTGQDDWDSGNARIQPSSDGVNAVGIGAATTLGPKWERAPYSSIGPGRNPGFVKPDLLAFGGSNAEPFWILDQQNPGFSGARMGTSYAAPYGLRTGVGIKAHFGGQLSAAAIRALMVHHSVREDQPQREVGWGRTPSDVSDLVVCPEGEVTVVYQGILEPSQFIQFEIPVPRDQLKHDVTIKSTFCIFAPVDPEDSLNYTRAGLTATFRPSTVGHPGYYKGGKARGTHPSMPFFQASNYSSTETEMRRDGHKWETILRAEHTFDGNDLQRPVFDVEHHSRVHGQPAARRIDISYALVVSISSEGEQDIYNRILAAYPNRLEILRPTIQIQVRRP
jgi:hypothetical protein